MENELRSSNAGQGMGIAALVLGILAVIASFIPCFGLFAILFGVLAIIFGAVGLSQAKKGNASVTMPKTGLILGIVATAFVIVWMIVVVGAFGAAAYSAADEIKDSIENDMQNISNDSIPDENLDFEMVDTLDTSN
ncbi:DUF4190 domain-containing protein [Flavobacterium tegetincola]|uniref:DUF4190 domain-containing protein n=1 Tax=Flavobacterium tegetincola TaxID=150172 RepID=UPI0004147A35|nr:DUF4190 domain-containing protein [Flavobacterium tegetincola]